VFDRKKTDTTEKVIKAGVRMWQKLETKFIHEQTS